MGNQGRSPVGAVLDVDQVHKRYGATHALAGVSLRLQPGRVYGLIGVNGSGKSTLLQILAGADRMTAGRLSLDGATYRPRSVAHAARMGICLVPQELPVVPRISVADNVLLGRWPSRLGVLRPRELHHHADQELRLLGSHLDVGTPVGDLSLADQQLTVIARTLARRPRVLLLDEPTSALAGEDVLRLRRIIREIGTSGRTVLIVSQRLDDVFAVCDEVLVLRNGQLVCSTPVDRLTADGAIDLMLHGPDRPTRPPAPVTPAPVRPSSRDEEPALQIDGLSLPGSVASLDLRVGKREVVGLAGLPGSGTSELLRALFGLTPGTTGSCRLFGVTYRPRRPSWAIARGIAYVTGNRQEEGLVADSSVATNIAMVRNRRSLGGPRRLSHTYREAVQQVRALQIRPGDPDLPVRALSGGNQQKVVFARWMLHHPTLWLLDDATRGVDIGARRDIHAAVRAHTDDGAAALVVSSDLLELFEVCDRVVLFRQGHIVNEFDCAETTPAEVEALTTGTRSVQV